ncbi:hypothetical protein D910_02052 [Dendroctonus ponderosae]|uniref:Uncharacterized protein n=1 Tax=Dendroctonus ponderosae TaxID=77166 RepID=U4TSX5_DENPD|nr:hypothetical protein D910_02052 [Dendroctonus ponderosae]
MEILRVKDEQLQKLCLCSLMVPKLAAT